LAKILIIDDEPAIRGLLRLQLEKAGYSVIEAADGIEGLLTVKTETPDLIFLDVMIPKMDGWQVCQEIKKKYSQIPVIMLTTLTQTIEEMRGWESGADEYVGKPWSVDQVLEIVAKFLKPAPPK
jgi:DNA-binding response OmpR family regulator